jgi:hypothetical protein
MSVRAENRYKAFAARQGAIDPTDLFLCDLNAAPKDPRAATPFGDIVFVRSHGGWFAECPITGFGYWYATLRQAVAAWKVAIFLDDGKLIGQPFK